jgi:3-dehydroquinate synthase
VSEPPVETVSVVTGSGGYDVLVGDGLLDRVGEYVGDAVGEGKAVVVTDDHVGDLYALRAKGSLEAAGIPASVVVVPAGERSKSWATAGHVLEECVTRGLDREGTVVALGGGVVGDLAGFCAATYMRGVSYVQLPTTLLSQVDSSVGGKTAVDLEGGKNLAGAFWQPTLVLADTATLDTLSDQEWTSGMVEVAKAGLLGGDPFLSWLEGTADRLRERDADAVREAVTRSVRFKAGVVAEDEREAGPRESLNLGHTLGHAIERVAGYGDVAHGEAVADGIRFAAGLAEGVLGTDPAWTARQERLVAALGPPRVARTLEPEALLAAMRADKKARGGEVRFVLSTGAGSWVVRPVADEVILRHLEEWTSEAARIEEGST